MNYTINEIPDEAVELSGNEMIPIWQGETKKVSVATLAGYVQDSASYSTTETLTGGKWIDGKPIYRRCIPFGNKTVTTTSQVVTTELNNTYISTLINQGLTWSTGATSFANGSYVTFYVDQTSILIASKATTFTTGANACCWFEYTKTTD